MDPLLALAVIVGLVVVATLVGLLWRARNGRVRDASGVATLQQTGLKSSLEDDAQFGSDATIVQFSTEFCGPCRIAERVLSGVAAQRDGIAYLDVDLTTRPQLATEFGVLQTPTILLVDAAGGIRSRIVGVPKAHEVTARLDEITKENHVVVG
ncbi:thioredoxin family protein [Planctomonas sp. JC2975]|uniref:thioredoxin family protein n=1 Tax=Planctomonas sp. JC2975 TaxID=2729626 RepID=UPI0014739753|nr:thioredoxin family protein [Planctomonas sp. JC2975]NNC13351.1 thioredoxin family protein [Planctomonas sp. JC2975]